MFVVVLAAASLATGGQENFEWQKAAPETQGMSAQALDAATEALSRKGTKTFLVIRNDKIVHEWYAPGFGPTEKHYTASMAKALVGGVSLMLALNDGRLGADDPACNYIPEWKGHPQKSKITIRHLATHSSGIEDAEQDGIGHMDLPGWKGQFWKRKPDPFSISRDQAPVVFEPGSQYAYSNPGMALLSYAVTASLRGTGHTDVRTLLRERIMRPIGVADDDWSIGYGATYKVEGLPLVANWGGGGYTARAVARVGRLMLRKGNWQGRQLVDPQWVEEVVRVAGTPLPDRSAGNPAPASGLGWWVNTDGVWAKVPRDAFAGAGAGNQVLLVVPSLNLIVVRNGADLYDPSKGEGFWGGIERYLFNPVMEAVVNSSAHAEASLPAEGFGATAAGGRGGRVIEVTNLNDSGAGSLRAALSARGPRIIRFAVEGTIELKSPLAVTEGQATLDGETAPGQGITLLNHGIHFRGDCKDIIVRHLRIRVTTGGSSGDGLLLWGTDGGTVERVLVDHCSVMGATDENVDTWGQVRDVTFQWTIIAEGRPPHSMGWLSGAGSDRITIHHCLFAHNADRSPRLAGGLYDVVNNVIYNWSHHNAAKIGGGARANFVNNVFIPGPQSTATQACILPEDPDKGTKIHLAGNMGPFTPNGSEDQWLNVTYYQRVDNGWIEHRPAPESFRADKPCLVDPVSTQSAKEAYDLVLARVGAKVRDADDLRVIEEVKARTGQVGGGRQ